MSTPTAHLAAPPIPRTLELDPHSRNLFFPAEHSGPVDARFHLNFPVFKDMVFIGRVARFCTGALHMVIREVTGDAEVDANAPVLVSALAMPFSSKDPAERLARTRSYFARELHYPDSNGHALDWRDRVPTLRDSTLAVGFDRLHFDSATGLKFRFREDSCSIVDTRNLEPGGKVTASEAIEFGDALFDYEWVDDPTRAFMKMSDEEFHQRAGAMLRNEQSPLAHNVRFHLMDRGERSRFVFGCEAADLKRAREMLKLALQIEMGAGEALCGWSEARWQPFAEDNLVEGRGIGKGGLV